MNWSARQQAMLEAMGLQVMVRASAGALASSEPREKPAVAAMSSPIATPAAAASESGADREHSELSRALSRAAGGRDLAGLVDDLARLRREPALKRALWPRLRMLRRSH